VRSSIRAATLPSSWRGQSIVVRKGIVLTGDLPMNEFLFHATGCYASGGMALSGDDLSKMPPNRMAILKKLVPPIGIAAELDDESM
jgi:hypothetical protein